MTLKMRPKPKLKQPLPKSSFWGNTDAPIAIAHRGGDGAGADKENTLAAFRAAVKMGYEYGETDVILTADGQVIAIHGATNFLDTILKAKPSRNGLQKKTLREIRRGVKPYSQIPLLSELLQACPDMKFFIDPKTSEVVEPLAELLRGMRVLDRVCIGSFDYKRVMRMRDLLGAERVATSLIIGRGLRLVNRKLDMLKTGRLSHVQAVKLHHSLMSREMVDLVHSQGFKAIVWTANSKLAMENAIKSGVDGIISDRVSLLKEVLSSKP